MNRYLAYFFLIFIVVSCDKNKTQSTKEITTQLYKVYRERADFEKFLSFYDEDMILEDFIFGERIEGKENFKAFFDWPNPKFQKLEADALVVEDIIVEDSKAVVTGYFTSFKWGEYESKPMRFTTILEFNEAGKIIKHKDWINYHNTLIDYEKRKDSNDWLR